MATASKTVSAAAARGVFQAAKQHGISPKEFQQRTGIFELELSNPQGRIPAAKHIAMMRMFAQLRIPFHTEMSDFSELLRPFPTLAAILTNGGNLCEAFENYAAYRDLFGEVDPIVWRRDGSDFQVEYYIEGEGRSALCAYGHFAILAGLTRLYDPEGGRVRSLELTGRPFASPSQLSEAVGCAVRFEQPSNRIRLNAAGADARNSGQNHFLYRFFLDQAKAERATIRAKESFEFQVERFLAEVVEAGGLLDFGNGLFAAACEHFGISRWKLQRRLQPENTNFQEILVRVRIDAARRLLSRAELSISEISDRLAFSSPSVFSRFFSEHCGLTPSHFRDTHIGLQGEG